MMKDYYNIYNAEYCVSSILHIFNEKGEINMVKKIWNVLVKITGNITLIGIGILSILVIINHILIKRYNNDYCDFDCDDCDDFDDLDNYWDEDEDED